MTWTVVQKMKFGVKKLRLIWIENKPCGFSMSCSIQTTIEMKQHVMTTQWEIDQAYQVIGRPR